MKIFQIALTICALFITSSCSKYEQIKSSVVAKLGSTSTTTSQNNDDFNDFEDVVTSSLFSSNYSSKKTTKQPKFTNSNQYVAGTEDIPLFPSLKEVDTTSFDSKEGGIIISSYHGMGNIDSIREFYLSSLPQLGWRRLKQNNDSINFARKSQILDLTFNKGISGEVSVKFIIYPTSS